MTADPVSQFSLAQPGDLVAGKYRVERIVAIGGMGVVLAARNEDLDQQVAIKILRQDALANEEAVTRFLREARTAAKLQNEHIARVFDVGTVEGVPYMVMEYLTGQDLQQVVGARGSLPIEEAVDYIMQTLEAVADAHAAGVIHRDLKPSNLFLATRADGTQHVKVLDFGISKGQGLDAPASPALTSTKQVMGSPGYMSPEQMMTPRSVDGRTDIWSIGVLLYALLTGEQAFQGETVAQVMANILHQPIPKLRERRKDASAGLERIIERCLEREVTARYLHVGQLARALAPYGTDWSRLSAERVESSLGNASPAGQTLLNLAGVKTEEFDSMTSAAWARTSLRSGSGRKVLLGVGAFAALAGAIALGTWIGRGGSSPSTASTNMSTTPVQNQPPHEPATSQAATTEVPMSPPSATAISEATGSPSTDATAPTSTPTQSSVAPYNTAGVTVRPTANVGIKPSAVPSTKPTASTTATTDLSKLLEDRK